MRVRAAVAASVVAPLCAGLIWALSARVLAAGADAGPDPLADLDPFVEEAIAAWRVPGLALAVVRGGEPVLRRGYGVRRLGDADAVDPDTLLTLPELGDFLAAGAPE